MCRLMAYSGAPILAADLLFRPSRSIVRQSFDAQERANGAQLREVYAYGQLNADGFGLAFYGNIDDGSGEQSDRVLLPCVFTECQPAWNSKNLRRLAEKIQARLFFAHVRAAGPGLGVCDCKTHPFTFGRFTFMHNGEIAGFSSVRRKLLTSLRKDESFNLALAHGATDTAVAFALFVDQLASPTELLPANTIVQYLKNAIKTICDSCEEADVDGACKLNFVVSDGLTIVGTRYTFDLHKQTPGASLYYASGSSFAPTSNVEEAPQLSDPSVPATKAVNYRIFHSEKSTRMTIIASEPLTEVRSDWVSVPENHVVVVLGSGEVLCAPFFLRFEPCLRAKFAVNELTRAFSFLESQKTTLPPASSPSMSSVDGHKSLVRRESAASGPVVSAKSPRQQRGGGMEATNSPFVTRSESEQQTGVGGKVFAAPHAPRPMLRCRSSRMHSFEENADDFYGEDEPPQKKKSSEAFNRLSLRDPASLSAAGGGNVIEICNPYHVLAASGQVHVSAMLRFGNLLFSADGGAAGGRVCAYDLQTFELVAWSSNWGILSLCCDTARGLLFGSRSDGAMVVWDVSDPTRIRGELHSSGKIILPRIGHVLSMCVVQSSSLVVGSQDGFLRRIRLPGDVATAVRAIDCPAGTGRSFNEDSVGKGSQEVAVDQGLQEQQQRVSSSEVMKICGTTCVHCNERERMPISDMARSHCGFVTAVQILEDSGILFSAGSCSLIKKWDLSTNECLETLGGHQGSVMDLCTLIRGESVALLFSAALDGTVRAWDASPGKDTCRFLRALHAPYDDPLSCVCVVPSSTSAAITIASGRGRSPTMDRICAGSTSGAVWVWEFTPAMLTRQGSSSFPQAMMMPRIMLNVSSSPINSLAYVRDDGSSIAVGAGSGRISMWKLPVPEKLSEADRDEYHRCGSGGGPEEAHNEENEVDGDALAHKTDDDALLASLAQFVAIRSISSDPVFREDCLDSATFMQVLMEQMGCETRYCRPRGRESIPCVLGRLQASAPNPDGRFVFVYGHHDVVAANGIEWNSDPWTMAGLEGFVYGRGVSDNKGPVLAMLFGAAELERQGALGIDVVFCVEGEEESPLTVDQRRLQAVFTDYADFIWPNRPGSASSLRSPPQCIIISNNTWMNESRPCITYGMRGVLDVELRVQSAMQNLHSGVHGGALFEPLNDLVNVLHTCTGLKDELAQHAKSLDEEELARLRTAAAVIDQSTAAREGLRRDSETASSFDELVARWAQNTLSVSTIQTSNADNSFRKVPSMVSARVSIHFAPGLSVEKCKEMVVGHFEREFAKQKTANSFALRVVNVSDPWLGDVTNDAFKAMAIAVENVWGVPPLFVREGGSYSGITSFLERELSSRAVHLPMAQANDRAHLHDERIRVENLVKGKRVFQELLGLMRSGF